jgi:NADPH:quinone reductase-like Zn-dependent oxidoreductase
MKAVQIKKYGGVDILELVDIEKPIIGPGQVLIENHASCINPIDSKIREGMIPVQFPFTLGADLAGVVVQVGEGVKNYQVGDKVYGQGIVLAGASGAFAEFVASPANLVAMMPQGVSFDQSAASVLTGVSAVQALIEYMNLQSGQKILIHGGAGGIGTVAIQIAKKMGAYVATTVTQDEMDYVKSLGADQTIDYNADKFEQLLSDFDAVFDTVGGDIYMKSFKVLRPGGVLVSMLEKPNEDLMKQCQVTAISQMTQVTAERLNILTKFIEDGVVKIHIDKVFSLDQVKEAFEAKENGKVKGKIVIQIK